MLSSLLHFFFCLLSNLLFWQVLDLYFYSTGKKTRTSPDKVDSDLLLLSYSRRLSVFKACKQELLVVMVVSV